MLLTIFDQARRQGHGNSDISSIVEVIRTSFGDGQSNPRRCEL
jgi:hypothetical protein